ncbi:nucleoside phosphorylase domain-containing protein [Aspergillus nidulans var. acristatus]
MSQSAPLQTSDAPPLFRHFTVGWITAIETEFLAATQILDAKYDAKKINLPTGDKNVYTLGRIGEHNVVIATLPPNIYGTRSATAVANGIQRNFPMVRVVLMVGVAGGAPAQSDVRLGDVVVGTRVVPYDFGKERPNHLEFTGDFQVSNSTLLNGTQYRHTESCDCLYERPRELEMIVPRPQRKSYDRIKIHCGSIGSADKVVKDAIKRDKLTLEHGLLCFEMESAGIIPLFKYLLPIRGICDYSDSHNSKQWQGYAAAAAAVYAKCFLDAIPSADLDAQIPPDADEMERYVRLVAQMVMRVISSASPGPESGLHDADNVMKEIKESVAMLVDMAKRNSDGIQRMSDEDSAAHARRHMERIAWSYDQPFSPPL